MVTRSGKRLDGELVVSTATTSHLEDELQPVTADELDIDDAAHILDEIQRMMWWDDENGCWDPDKEVSGADVIEHIGALFAEHGMVPGGDDGDE